MSSDVDFPREMATEGTEGLWGTWLGPQGNPTPAQGPYPTPNPGNYAALGLPGQMFSKESSLEFLHVSSQLV